MTRFAWLQARVQSLSGAAIIVILAIVAAITGIELSHVYHSTVASCTGNCDLTINHFLSHDSFLQGALNFLLRIAPAILGVFWGAPLVAREFEAGTYRLAWTQSVSRSRWLLTKLAIGALATIIAAGAFSLIVTWWFRGIDHVNNNQFDVFDARLLLVFTCKSQHVIRHIQSIGLARRADALRRQQNVDAAARPKIEHSLSELQLRKRGRIAAAERGQNGLLR